MLQRRFQVMIDEARFQRIRDRAHERHMSVSAVVRELVDTALPATDAARRAAASQILDAEPMEVPDPASLRAELELARAK